MIINITIFLLLFTGLTQSQNKSVDDLVTGVFGDLTSAPDEYPNLTPNPLPPPNLTPTPTQASIPTPIPSQTPTISQTPLPSQTPTISQTPLPPPTQNINLIPQPAINFTGCPSGMECVKLYQCKDGLIIKDGTTLIDIRFDEGTPQQCQGLEICCAHENKVDKPLITPKPVPSGCGYRNSDGIAFKITGDKDHETQYGEFPWMVAIMQEERTGKEIFTLYKCGGSLIHPSVILTAAHCVDGKDPTSFIVRAGEWDTQTTAELFPNQDRNVVDIVVHKDYYRGALFNDIALIFVDQPFIIEENVKTICLPPSTLNFDEARCYATGWGKDTFGQDGKYQAILKKIELPVVPRDKCQNDLRNTRLGSFFELHQSFICAGGEPGKDTCKGDGGSPLVCPILGQKKPGEPERYYQAGIVAWGIGCNDPIPGVYASVTKLRPWIDEQLAYKRIDSVPFTP